MSEAWVNQLHYGDNLEVLREKIPDESVDLIYLDPPFNSQRTYNLLFKQVKGDPVPAQIIAFEDTWTWSPLMLQRFRDDPSNSPIFDLMESLYGMLRDSEMMAYLLMMGPRLLELHKKLRRTGSLYLHCDPVASHYLKILLDAIFKPQNFRNEITWKRTFAHGNVSRNYGKVADIIFWYTKSDKYTWNQQYAQLTKAEIEQKYPHVDPDGRRWQSVTLRNPGYRPNLIYDYTASNGVTYKPHRNGWVCVQSRLAQLDREGRLHFPSSPDGALRVKMYADESPGEKLQNIWSDIAPVGAQSLERRGYPTQKPLALLERILAASSKPGDVVLDPFCGCGTAVVAAQRMGRKWIGIDITYLAVAEIVYRLSTETDARRDVDYKLIGSPRDEMSARKFFEQTAPQNHKPFEMWAVHLVEGEPQEKKGADKNIDGRIPFRGFDGKLRWGLIQVKGGHVGPHQVREFARSLDRDHALLGLFICFNVTKDMKEEAEKMGFAEGIGGSRRCPRLQILTIKQLLEERKPYNIPEGWRVPRAKGMGKAVRASQAALDLSDELAEELSDAESD